MEARPLTIYHIANLAGCWVSTAVLIIASAYIAHTHGHTGFVNIMMLYALVISLTLIILAQAEKSFLLKSPYGRVVRGAVAWLTLLATMTFITTTAMGTTEVLKRVHTMVLFFTPWSFILGILLYSDVLEEKPPQEVKRFADMVLVVGTILLFYIILVYI